MRLHARIMENAVAYRLWQAPFAEQKLAPVFAHNPRGEMRRVLDVGCGPGTNTAHFAGCDYLGIDINESYVETAARRTGRQFIAADVTQYRVSADERFDFILVNSLLHHIEVDPVRSLLGHLAELLSDDGHVHIVELVLPEQAGIARTLARLDRGEYPRPLGTWRELFAEAFEPVVFEPYRIQVAGATLWELVYFKGRARCR